MNKKLILICILLTISIFVISGCGIVAKRVSNQQQTEGETDYTGSSSKCVGTITCTDGNVITEKDCITQFEGGCDASCPASSEKSGSCSQSTTPLITRT